MCENTYTACGGCNEHVTDLRFVEDRRETVRYNVDEDGDPDWDSADSEYCDSDEGGHLECPACGWTGIKESLDFYCEPDECECDECCPVEPGDEPEEHNRDDIVRLVRTDDSSRLAMWKDCPPEVRQLFTDRTLHFLPMPRWRAHEIWEEWLSDNSFPCLRIDYSNPNDITGADIMHNYNEREEVAA